MTADRPVPRGARLCKGIALPATEVHFVDMITHHSKVGRVTLADGRSVGTYQLHKLRLAMKYLDSSHRRVAVDIGAHVGLWSMHLAEMFDHVSAFEPVPLHRECFAWNVRTDNVMLHPVALGAGFGDVRIAVPPDNTGHAHVRGGDYGPCGSSDMTDPVGMNPLDYYKFADVDFIKIDVEGLELQVCQGAEQTIKRCRPIMVVEQKGNDSGVYGGRKDEALEWLLNHGARVLGKYSGDWILGF